MRNYTPPEKSQAAIPTGPYTGPVTHAISDASPSPSVAGPMQAKRSSEVSREETAKAEKGDYSGYFKINSKDRKKLTDPKKDMIESSLNSGMGSGALAKVYGRSTSDLLNPVTRQAMSEMARSKDIAQIHKDILKNAMDDMDQEILVQTMLPVSDLQKENLRQHYQSKGDLKRLQKEYRENGFFKSMLGEETMSSGQVNAALNGPERTREEVDALVRNDVDQAESSGAAMMKLMLLMQMGNFTKTTKDKKSGTKETTKWDRTMANALAHGGRVGFLFDASKPMEGQPGTTADTYSIMARVFGTKSNGESTLKSRSAATHRLLTPDAGQGMRGYKEEHGKLAALKSKTDSGYRNYGMDMSVGGAGNAGVQGEGGAGQIITTDGRSGHMYVGERDSTQTKRGGMLVGMETDSPYRSNQYGHMHTAMAKGGKFSSTGGLKYDIEGAKYGGRTVDFNGATNEDIALTLDAFNNHLNQLKAG